MMDKKYADTPPRRGLIFSSSAGSSIPIRRAEPYVCSFDAVFTGPQIRNEFSRNGGIVEHGQCAPLPVTMRRRDLLIVGRMSDTLLDSKHDGRDLPYQHVSEWQFRDPTMSNLHLRVYSIQFDDSGNTDALVFAQDLSSNGCYLNGVYMGRGRPAMLLSNGDSLKLSDRITLKIQCRPSPNLSEMFSDDQRREIETFKSSFVISTRELGTGAHGKVVMATKVTSKKQIACKVIDMAKFSATEIKKQRNMTRGPNFGAKWNGQDPKSEIAKKYDEIDILKDLSHPNIVIVEKIFHTEGALYIMQEMLAGGDLYSYLGETSQGWLDQAKVGHIIKQVLEAVKYLHGHDIVHRDIKLENVLVADRGNDTRVVLADFGAARRLIPSSTSPLRRMTSLAGTYGYMAPEVWDESRLKQRIPYTKGIDVWSVGCMTFALLTGNSAFTCAPDTDSAEDMVQELKSFPWHHRSIWEKAQQDGADISPRIKDFVRKCLVVDQEQRMTADEALEHDFFTHHDIRGYFDEHYAKIVRNWQPRPQIPNLVEEIVIPRGVKHRGKYSFGSSRRSSKSSQSPPTSRSSSPRPQPHTHTLRQLHRAESPTGMQGSLATQGTNPKKGHSSPRGARFGEPKSPFAFMKAITAVSNKIDLLTAGDSLSVPALKPRAHEPQNGLSHIRDPSRALLSTPPFKQRDYRLHKDVTTTSPSRFLSRTSLRRPSKSASGRKRQRHTVSSNDKTVFDVDDGNEEKELPSMTIKALDGTESPNYRPSPSSSPTAVIMDSEIDMPDTTEETASSIVRQKGRNSHEVEKAKKRKAGDLDISSVNGRMSKGSLG